MTVSRLKIVFMVIVLCFFSGCTALGPRSIESDRFEYSGAIAESWKKMMLLNIVKLRYGDTPIFLEIGSIVNQYTLETEVAAGANLQSGDLFGDGVSFGGKGKYADRPTITYTPLTGKKFSKSLLTPIPPEALFSLVKSGWSADFLLKICLTAINDMYNSSGRQKQSREADSQFTELLETLTEVQQAGGLGARLVTRDSGKTIIFFRRNLDSELKVKIDKVRELLGLAPGGSEFSLVYGSTAANNKEIAMLTRSMLDITAELAQYVHVPEQHVRENRASPVTIARSATVDGTHSRIFIKSSPTRPEDPFLAIEYRDHWFYIDDTDYRSKRVFSFLLFLFTLAESGPQGVAPVLTLPAG